MDTVGSNKDTAVTDGDMDEVGTNPTTDEGEKEEGEDMPMPSSVGSVGDEEDDEEGENSNDNVM